MTTRDIAWRASGIALFGLACAIGPGSRLALVGAPGAIDTVAGLLGFAFAIFGLVLLVQGKRVSVAWRVERSRHRNLVAAIHARRRRASADRPAARP